jgi:hypothetical protein
MKIPVLYQRPKSSRAPNSYCAQHFEMCSHCRSDPVARLRAVPGQLCPSLGRLRPSLDYVPPPAGFAHHPAGSACRSSGQPPLEAPPPAGSSCRPAWCRLGQLCPSPGHARPIASRGAAASPLRLGASPGRCLAPSGQPPPPSAQANSRRCPACPEPLSALCHPPSPLSLSEICMNLREI